MNATMSVHYDDCLFRLKYCPTQLQRVTWRLRNTRCNRQQDGVGLPAGLLTELNLETTGSKFDIVGTVPKPETNFCPSVLHGVRMAHAHTSDQPSRAGISIAKMNMYTSL